MPPQSTTTGQPQLEQQQLQNGRRRPVAARIVPAIPLALSRPKSIRPQSHVRLDSDVSPTPAIQETIPEVNRDNRSGDNDIVSALRVASGQVEAPTRSDNVVLGREPKKSSVAQEHLLTPSAVTGPTTGHERSLEEPSASPAAEHKVPPAQIASSNLSATDVVSTHESAESRDMHQVNTENPHPSVLSASQYTPQLVVVPTPPHRLALHRNQASTSSIVFGGQDAMNPSPTPPTSSSSFLVPKIPSIDSAPDNHWTPPNHKHHISDSSRQRPVAPATIPATPWNLRQGFPVQQPYSPTMRSHAHQSFRYPPREVFMPTEPRQQNGLRSRSASRTSTTAGRKGIENMRSPPTIRNRAEDIDPWYHEPNGTYQGPSPVRFDNLHMPLPPVQVLPHGDIWNMQVLRSHIEPFFSTGVYADCILDIQEGFIGGAHYHFKGHKMLLSRSQMLLDLISASDHTSSPARVHVRLDDSRLRLHPLLDSLKFIYGGPLPQAHALRHAGFDRESMATNVAHMNDALRYIAIGGWLKMPAIATRGIEVAACLLHWDTITTALGFALEGGISPMWSQFDDNGEDKSPLSSSDDSFTQITGIPKYEPYSTPFLQRIIQSVMQMLPSNFYLDASAPQLQGIPRLPSLSPSHTSRASQSDPRLSKIRFGDVPVEDLQRPSFVTTTSSSILLSLPFQILKYLLEHPDLAARLGPETVASIMRQVVAERELQRTKVVQAQAGRSNTDIDVQLVQNLDWTEMVEPSSHHRAGFRLTRRKKGVDTPPSSGTESIRS